MAKKSLILSCIMYLPSTFLILAVALDFTSRVHSQSIDIKLCITKNSETIFSLLV